MKLSPASRSRASSIRSSPLKSWVTKTSLGDHLLYRSCLVQFFESSRKVSQHRRLVDHRETMNALSVAVESLHRLRHVADLHVRIDPARNVEPNHFELRMEHATGRGLSLSEHHGADFDSSDPMVPIQCEGSRWGWQLVLRDVW